MELLVWYLLMFPLLPKVKLEGSCHVHGGQTLESTVFKPISSLPLRAIQSVVTLGKWRQ